MSKSKKPSHKYSTLTNQTPHSPTHAVKRCSVAVHSLSAITRESRHSLRSFTATSRHYSPLTTPLRFSRHVPCGHPAVHTYGSVRCARCWQPVRFAVLSLSFIHSSPAAHSLKPTLRSRVVGDSQALRKTALPLPT